MELAADERYEQRAGDVDASEADRESQAVGYHRHVNDAVDENGGHDHRARRPQDVTGNAAGPRGEGNHDHPEVGQEDRYGNDNEEREQCRLAGEPRAPGASGQRLPIGSRPERAARYPVDGRHQCTSIRAGCRSLCISIKRHNASAATTPITTSLSESAAPYAYSPLSNARR